MSVWTFFSLSLRCIFYFLDCWWYLEIYNWRYVEIVGNIGNFRVWSSANKCVWHTINTASRSGLKLTRPQLGQKFYKLFIFNHWVFWCCWCKHGWEKRVIVMFLKWLWSACNEFVEIKNIQNLFFLFGPTFNPPPPLF